jgi:hypothetical protein
MKYIEKLTPKETKEELVFGRTGLELTGEDKHRQPHCAKVIKSKTSSSITYYVHTYQGALFDPQGPYGRRRSSVETSPRRVSKNTFDFYMTYLKTNNSIYLTKAQRGFLND